MNKDNNDYML